MSKQHRLFWSYDAEKTEKWLADEARQGRHLVGLNRWTRSFRFAENQPEVKTYRIAFERRGSAQLPSALLEQGWEQAVSAGPWKISSNSRQAETVGLQPSREGIVHHNRNITFLFYILAFYFAGMLLANLSMVLSSYFRDGGLNIVPSPLWAVTFLFFSFSIALTILAIYSIIKIRRTNASLENRVIHQKSPSYTGGQQHYSGKLVRRFRLAWVYSPDFLESWLESMEGKGFRLVQVHRAGAFFSFAKGEPQQYAYRVDHQISPTEAYFSLHEDAGWERVFDSMSTMDKWVIWRKEWEAGERRPAFYSDGASRIRQAKRSGIIYTCLFLPVVLLFVFNIINAANGTSAASLAGISIFGLLLYSWFIYRLWSYYMRTKKSAAA